MMFVDGAEGDMILDTSQEFGAAVHANAFTHASLTVQLAGFLSDDGYEHQSVMTFYVPVPPHVAEETESLACLEQPLALHSYVINHKDMCILRDLFTEMCEAADNPIAWREQTDSLLDKYDASDVVMRRGSDDS